MKAAKVSYERARRASPSQIASDAQGGERIRRSDYVYFGGFGFY
jgi:hypothetical protein